MAHSFYRPKKKKERKLLDELIYPIGLIAPIMTVPQLVDVWNKPANGSVSILTWGAYAFVSFFWIIYGLFHREKPIVLINCLLLVLNLLIVYGVLINK